MTTEQIATKLAMLYYDYSEADKAPDSWPIQSCFLRCAKWVETLIAEGVAEAEERKRGDGASGAVFEFSAGDRSHDRQPG